MEELVVGDTSARGVRLQMEARAGLGSDHASGEWFYSVVAMTPGEANGLHYSEAVLRAAAPLFDGATCLVDHAGMDDQWRGGRSLRQVLGVLRQVGWNEDQGGLMGTLAVYPGVDQEWFCRMADAYIVDRDEGRTVPRVGLSAVLDVRVHGEEVVRIERVLSVDAVFDPARGGEIIRALNQKADPLRRELLCLAAKARQTASPEGRRDVQNTASPEGRRDVQNNGGVAVVDQVGASREASGAEGEHAAVVAEAARAPCAAPVVPAGQAVEGAGGVLVALSESVMEMRLQRTQLPEQLRAIVRAEFGGRLANMGQMDARVEALQSAWGQAMAQHGGVVQGVGVPRTSGIQVGMNELDRMQAVVDRMAGLPVKSEALASIRPVSGIRDLYLMLTGDYDLRGIFDPERVQLANVTTSTMTSLVKNAFNKVILDYFNSANRWWEPIVSQEDFQSTQDLTLISLGGLATLPTVAEGAAYAELSWSDAEETVAFVKKGGYVGITLEMMDKDETRTFRAIPRKLAIAGYRSLSGAIATLFKANSGVGAYWPADQSTLRLFNAGTYVNLGSTALDAASWDVVIQAMYKMTEAGSGERMGIRPAFIVVPIELEKTALTVMDSVGEPGTGDNDINVRRGSSRVVVCPEMTDANDWLAVADPRVWPGIVVGYRFGRVPEVFVADQENVGSMFTNDEMRIKARFWFACGVADYRPLYKSNVT